MDNKNEKNEIVEVNVNQEQFKKELKKYKKYKWIVSGAFAILFVALLTLDVFMGWGKILFISASLISWLAFVIWG
jgi:hypothetical protein